VRDGIVKQAGEAHVGRVRQLTRKTAGEQKDGGSGESETCRNFMHVLLPTRWTLALSCEFARNQPAAPKAPVWPQPLGILFPAEDGDGPMRVTCWLSALASMGLRSQNSALGVRLSL
jgi:hypothetical protein